MKTVYLVRHANAILRDDGANDFKRSLTKPGRKDARVISEQLRRKHICPDLLISSPADRTLETAHIFAEQLDYPVHRILLKEGIYDKGEEFLMQILKSLDDSYSTVMLFGHEPALSQLTHILMKNFETAIQTAGVLGFSLDISKWPDMAEGSGHLIFSDFPVHETPKVLYKKARKIVEQEMTEAIEEVLSTIDGEVVTHLEKTVKNSCKKMTKSLLKALDASTVEELAGVKIQKRIDLIEDTVCQKSVLQPPEQKSIDQDVKEEERALRNMNKALSRKRRSFLT